MHARGDLTFVLTQTYGKEYTRMVLYAYENAADLGPLVATSLKMVDYEIAIEYDTQNFHFIGTILNLLTLTNNNILLTSNLRYSFDDAPDPILIVMQIWSLAIKVFI